MPGRPADVEFMRQLDLRRDERGWSSRELARRMGCDPSLLVHARQGARRVTPELGRLAVAVFPDLARHVPGETAGEVTERLAALEFRLARVEVRLAALEAAVGRVEAVLGRLAWLGREPGG